MTPELRTQLERWLASDDPVERRHAEYRLSLPDRIEPSPMPAYPPLRAQVAGLARSLWRWARRGFRLANRREVRRRQAICRACPFFDAGQTRCRKCGCSALAKPWLATESCPDGRW